MKKSNLLIGTFSFVLMTLMFLSSCSTISVSSRRYNKGLHFEWAKTSNSKEAVKQTTSKVRNATVECDVVAEEVVEVENVNTLLAQEVELDLQLTNEVIASKSNSIKLFNSIKKAKGADSEFLNDNFEVKSLSKKALIKAKMSKKSKREFSTGLLVVLAFLWPTLAVYLYEEEFNNRVIVNLILTFLCFLPGLIHALVIIIGQK